MMTKADSLGIPAAMTKRPWFTKQLKTAINNIIIRWHARTREKVVILQIQDM